MANNRKRAASPLAEKKTAGKTTPLKKRTASVSRWLHIYLSMVSFVIVLFFAVTGLTLNHPDWFSGNERVRKTQGSVQAKWVNVPDTATIAKLDIVELLRNKYHIQGRLGDFRPDETQCTLSFYGPGYSADVFIDRNTGHFELTETRFGLVAVMNDLHKGRDAGKKWGILIDAAAILMTLVSLTGLIMICFMKKKRLSGFIVLAVGALLGYLGWIIFVP